MAESFAISLFLEIRHQLESTLPELSERLLPAGKALLLDHAEQLENWASQAASGQLSEKDVEWLVRSQIDLSRLNALKAAGLAQVEIDLFRQALTRTIIGMLAGRIAS